MASAVNFPCRYSRIHIYIPFQSTQIAAIRQDALNAIAASLAMHQRLQQLNQQFTLEGKPLIELGIGIHTGSLTVGGVGSQKRMNYSVVGDTVNIAARLEALNKKIMTDNPYRLLLSGRTYAYVRDHYLAKGIQAIKLRGRETATMVYALLGERAGMASGSRERNNGAGEQGSRGAREQGDFIRKG
ncbi:MAG: adenylate/guanylate cyclase domain-containing protein [Cyanothece sp. SIO1E1]|nr:adenylate/guanylate cyclase domain-containing protein [Cyanothece sp. SIO1E1]